MVTAKGTEIDTVVGLEVGADDYVTKPYRLRELVARMRAVLRRTPPGRRSAGRRTRARPTDRRRRRAEPSDVRSGRSSRAAGIQLDPDRHLVFVRGEEVHLRRKEFELLALLMENAGRLLTRDVLIDRIWGSDYFGDTKTLDVHIKRLRSHIEEDPLRPPPHHHRPGRGLPVRRPRDELTRPGTRPAVSAGAGMTVRPPGRGASTSGSTTEPSACAPRLDQRRPDPGPGQRRAVEGVDEHRGAPAARAGSGCWPAGPGSRCTS